MFFISHIYNQSMQNRQKIYLFKAKSDQIKYLNSFGINQDDFIQSSFTKIKQIENETISE